MVRNAMLEGMVSDDMPRSSGLAARQSGQRPLPSMTSHSGLRVLMLSIVDPEIRRGGAWTVTRGLLEWLRREPWRAEVTVIAPLEPRWPAVRRALSVVAAPWTGVPAKVRFLRRRAYRRPLHARRRLDGLAGVVHIVEVWREWQGFHLRRRYAAGMLNAYTTLPWRKIPRREERGLVACMMTFWSSSRSVSSREKRSEPTVFPRCVASRVP